jgi:serine/threonine protein kinase
MSLQIKKCKKIRFQDSNSELSICSDAIKVDNDKYKIFGNKFIDKISRDILLYPNIDKYIAIKDTKLNKYALHPILENEDMKNQVLIPPQKNISSGTYGSVDFYKTQNVAVKHFKRNRLDKEDINEDFIKEIAIYKFLQSNCIPNFYNYEITNKYNIALELGENTLNSLLKYSQEDRIKILPGIMFNLLSCLRDINSLGIIHSDIKLGNIIINNQGKPKFIDWGLVTIDFTKLQNTPRSFYKYTPPYLSPEGRLLQAHGFDNVRSYNFKSDIFALGITFVNFYIGFYLQTNSDKDITSILLGIDLNKNSFEDICKLSDSSKTIKRRLFENLEINPEFADLFSHMLDFNEKTRWNHEQLLNHPIFKNKTIHPLPERKYKSRFTISDINEIWKSKGMNRLAVLDTFKSISLIYTENFSNIYLETFSKSALFLAIELLDFYIYKKDIINFSIENLIYSMVVLTSKIHNNVKDDFIKLNMICNIFTTKDRSTELKKELVLIQKDIIDTFEGNILHYTFYDYLSYKNDISKTVNLITSNQKLFLKKKKKILDCIFDFYYSKSDIYKN